MAADMGGRTGWLREMDAVSIADFVSFLRGLGHGYGVREAKRGGLLIEHEDGERFAILRIDEQGISLRPVRAES